MKRIVWAFALCSIITACTGSQYEKVFTVKTGDHAMHHTPVYVDFDEELFLGVEDICITSKGKNIPAQMEILPSGGVRIWWVVNQEAGESVNYGLTLNKECNNVQFNWKRQSPSSLILHYAGQPLLGYEHPTFDPNNIEDTKKPFHHVYNPLGTEPITKGLGGLFPHHRGIFFGYNHVHLANERVDIWHARNGERSEHASFTSTLEGAVMGGHVLKILWKDTDGNPFIEETREVRVFNQGDGESLIDFRSTLKALRDTVRLAGDLQHAGVQFRAAQYVADNPDKTRFIRPKGWDHLDPDKELRREHWEGMPWNAMHFVVDGDPFTVAYLSHPENAENTQMSERLYGRFGEFFPALLTPDKPLSLHYRFWVKAGDAPLVDDIELKYNALAQPPEISIK